MIKCTKFKEYRKGHLLGFAEIEVEKWGVVIRNIALFEKNGAKWLNLPGRPYQAEDGSTKVAPFLTFKDKDLWEIFMQQTREAILKWREENTVSVKDEKDVPTDIPF